MPLRVLIIPDKFKGTLTSAEAARAIARGWKQHRPEDSLLCLPISDGGDGFGEVFSRIIEGQPRTVLTVDAAHRPIRARWWWAAEPKTAIIESAGVIGLAQLPRGKYHPFQLDTRGLASVLKSAARCGAQQCIVGIGGSATNDGGFGLARALGWRFFTANDELITQWTALHKLKRVEPPPDARLFQSLVVAVDVQNPLLGARGATRVYGPQKGLRDEDLNHAEKCLRRLARVLAEQFNADKSSVPGAGAAGGLGFGLMVFAGAELRPGFDLVARKIDLMKQIQRTDLVITGEGSIDDSSLMGKGVGEIARLCKARNIHCIGLGGCVRLSHKSAKQFSVVRGLTDITTPGRAMKQPARWLEKLAAEVAREMALDGAQSHARSGRRSA